VLEIRLVAAHPDAARILAEQPGLSEVAIANQLITARCAGGAVEHAALLKRLVAAGLPVCRFAGREQNLEDLFMHLTEGKVQ
jgi:ABC-2 type transport system ATP-binding protein